MKTQILILSSLLAIAATGCALNSRPDLALARSRVVRVRGCLSDRVFGDGAQKRLTRLKYFERNCQKIRGIRIEIQVQSLLSP